MALGPVFPAILAAAQGGDDRAFALLWRDLNPGVLRYLRVAVGRQADDVAADAWLDVVRGLGRFRGDEADFRSWVFTTARRRMLDTVRREARRRSDPVPVDELPDLPAGEDPAATVLERLSTAAALALIAELPPAQAEVVALRVVGNLDFRQVAEIVGKRPGTVRVLAHRGLRGLAARLAQRTGAPGGVTR